MNLSYVEILKRKKEWFSKCDGVFQVIWWIKAGHIPDLEEAKARLSDLQEHGVTEFAFSFRKSFLPSAEQLNLRSR